MRSIIFLLLGLAVGGWLGWVGVSCATAAAPVAAADSAMRSYGGGCEAPRLSAEQLEALVTAELRYSPGDTPRNTLVVFRRDGDRANLEVVEDGHYDDSLRGESRFFELRADNGGWRALTCARELRCYRGESNGICD